MTTHPLKRRYKGVLISVAATLLPTLTAAHSLDACAPQVTFIEPDTRPASISPRSFTAQAALFLARVPEEDLKQATAGIAEGEAVPATYLFNGADTRWRLKSPMSYNETMTRGVLGLPSQLHYLVPSSADKPYGTIVVSGTKHAPGTLVNPSMVAHTDDGWGIIIEPHDLDTECHLDLAEATEAFLDGVAYYLDHHHQDVERDNLRTHREGRETRSGTFNGEADPSPRAHAIPEYDAGGQAWMQSGF